MITVAAVGDLILDEPNPESYLAPAAPVLRAADVAIGHLEVPHSDTTASQSTDVPAPPSDPAALKALAAAGFDVVTTAGNHVYDAGDVGVADTLAHARAAGLVPTGSGADLRAARTPAVVEQDGVRIGVLSYNCVGPRESWATSRKAGCAYVHVLTHYELDHASPGGPPRIYTFADPDSLAAMADDVARLRNEVDVCASPCTRASVTRPRWSRCTRARWRAPPSTRARTPSSRTTRTSCARSRCTAAGRSSTGSATSSPSRTRSRPAYVGRDGLGLARRHDDDMSVSMLVRGRNKLSVTLNLKEPAAQQVFADLVRVADVVVENYSPGVTSRLGIDYASVRHHNPKLVYTSISGFGAQGGPGSGKAMDSIIQALSGVMMTAGEPDDGPIRFGLPIGDLLAPLFGVIGTVAALLQAEHTGEGQHVDVSMLGALTSLMACEPFDAFDAVGLAQRTGSMVPRLAPFGILPTADGHIALCAPTDAFAAGVPRAMGREELADDERFRTRDARVHRADELHTLIGEWCKGLVTADALEALTAQGVPAAEVRAPSDAVRDPLVREREEVVPLVHPSYGAVDDLSATGVPIRFSGSRVGLDRPAPTLGEHNDDVYGRLLGYSQEQLSALASDSVI